MKNEKFRRAKCLLVIDRDWLSEKYLEKRLSKREIAKQAGCDVSIITREVVRHGFSRKRPECKPRIILPDTEFREDYLSGKPMTDMAVRFGCSEDVIRREARRFGLPPRKNVPIPQDLEELLVERKWLCSRVARHYQVCEDTVYKWIRETGLSDRHPVLARRGRRGIRGYRHDLGMSFRSRWEANYARILNYEGIVFEYEKHKIEVENGHKYVPDFRLMNGTFVEVKGLSTRSNLWKFEDAVRRYPDKNFVLVDKPVYKILEREYRHLPGWETNA